MSQNFAYSALLALEILKFKIATVEIGWFVNQTIQYQCKYKLVLQFSLILYKMKNGCIAEEFFKGGGGREGWEVEEGRVRSSIELAPPKLSGWIRPCLP